MHPKKLSSKSMDMTTGSTWKLLLSFAVPLLIGNLFQQLYNTVDSLVVGNFVGTEALAAVGSTTSIINTMVMFFNGTSIGASVIISRHYGAHDDKKLHLAVETTIMVTFLASILFTALGIFLAPLMLRFMSTPDDVLESASVYLRIYFSGIAGLLVYNMGSAVLRAVGDTAAAVPLLFQYPQYSTGPGIRDRVPSGHRRCGLCHHHFPVPVGDPGPCGADHGRRRLPSGVERPFCG